MGKDICYKKNFLKKVIMRVDFSSSLNDLDQKLPQIKKSLKQSFPFIESQKSIAQEFQISPEAVNQKNSEFTTWVFSGKEFNKKLTMAPKAFFVEYDSYGEYSNVKIEFLNILKTLSELYPDIVCSRLGLRYINEITIDNEKNPLNWQEYIDNNLLGIFSFYPDKKVLARVFHNLEFNFEDYYLRYQFGMHNPDFPAAIKQKTFILDYDAYYQGPQLLTEIPESLDKFHERIQELFELSITDRLREVMNA